MSPTLRRLWLSAAAVNNQTTCCDVQESDLVTFAKEARAWGAELPERAPLWTRLTGGLEDFLWSVRGARVPLGTSCLTTPPGMSFCETTTNCFRFGATQLKLEEILSTTAATPCVYFRPDGLSKQTLVKCLDLLNRNLVAPCAPSLFRVVMLYNRKQCRVLNQWFTKYESTGRTHVCITWNRLQVKHMRTPTTKPRWLAHNGPWELVLIDAGSNPVGAGIDTSQFAGGMARLSRRAQVWNRLPHDTEQHLSHRSRVRQFWEKWDALAIERKCILDKKRLTQADLRKLHDSYRETNESLIDCPCPRLPRVARLAQVDVSQSLLRPTCTAYAIIGRFPTYVGQVGAKARNQKRPPMRR